jgi:hypothetical protein
VSKAFRNRQFALSELVDSFRQLAKEKAAEIAADFMDEVLSRPGRNAGNAGN